MNNVGSAKIKLVAHETGDLVVFMDASGNLVTIQRAEGEVTRTDSAGKQVLFTGSEENARKVVDAQAEFVGNTSKLDKPRLPRIPGAGGSMGQHSPVPLVAIAGALAVVLALGLGVILGIQREPGSTSLGANIPAGQTVEEANQARGPAPEPAVTTPPAQPAIELPANIQIEDIPAEPTGEAREVRVQTTTSPLAVTAGEPVAPTAEPAPVAEVPTGDNPLADRVAAAEEHLEDAQTDARAAVADAGPDQASDDVEKMKVARDLLTSGSKIPLEVAEQLPHDLAEALKTAGAIQTPEEAAAAATTEKAFTIIKIPANIVDGYRDADGIASIPDQNSWIATGGNVRLPLPGGGDITSPDDIAAFALQP